MSYKLLNFAANQAGWFACVLSAAWGYPWVGVGYVAAWTSIHVWRCGHRLLEALLLLSAGALGYAVDSVIVLAGTMQFPAPATPGWPAPLWMVALWVNLAATLNVSLAWFRGRYVLGMLLGMVGAPLAYWAGHRLGAVALAEPVWQSVGLVSVMWAMAMPLLLVLANVLTAAPVAADRRSAFRMEAKS